MIKFHLLFLSLVTVSLAIYTPKSKGGNCPIDVGDLSICSECLSDYDCSGSKICCHSSIGPCAKSCVFPVRGVVDSSIGGIGGSGSDTLSVRTGRIVNIGGGRDSILHPGMIGGTDGILGRGSGPAIDTVDMGGLSGGGNHGQMATHVSDIAGAGDIESMIDDGFIPTRNGIRRINTGGPSGIAGNGHLLDGQVGISNKAILKTIGGMRGGSQGSGRGVVRAVDVLDAISRGSGRTSGSNRGSSSVVGGGCINQCHFDQDCKANNYCVSLSDGCSKVCRKTKNNYPH